MKKIIESLSPIERKILPYLYEKDINEICKKSNLDKITVLRALEYLQKKEVLKLNQRKIKVIELGVNGILYKKKGLPERRLLSLLDKKRIISLEEAEKESKLSTDELNISIGVLKRKALIELKNGKIILSANKEEISKKSLEEIFIEFLPLNESELTPEQSYSLKTLEKRRNIIEINEKKEIELELTNLGKELIKENLGENNLIEQITPETIKKEQNWKGKKFRRYDLISNVPRIYGGKRHFVNSAIDYGKKVWIEMGFKEMRGNLVQSSFWNFDALFTPQDHPVREMQDTFFLNKKLELPDKKIVKAVKETHEIGIVGSKGWNYKWDEEKAKKAVLRTHTTCLSSKKISELKKEDLPAKFFAIDKCFRNETIDWNHGFEFNQNANFKHLLGYLKEFAKKMGFEKVRFRPSYFPYTEPSLEGEVWNEERKEWMELFAAGIFRPEITTPLFGKPITVLAWGPGFDRMIMKIFGIKDIRELYKNDLKQLREVKTWLK